MLPPQRLFCEQMRQADIAVIEGHGAVATAMASTPLLQHSRDTKTACCPVNPTGGRHVFQRRLRLPLGFQHFDPTLNLAGVIVNRVTSDAHYQPSKMPLNIIAHCRYWVKSPSLRRRRIT